jgi:hypothetical protein
MTEVAVRESVTLAGRAERARVARTFVGGVLGPGHPCGDVAVLLVSELFSYSLRHSGSAAPGGTVAVTVTAGAGSSGWRSLTGAAPGCQSCALLTVTRVARPGASAGGGAGGAVGVAAV